MFSEKYKSVVLNDIRNHLIHTKKIEEKPYFPFDSEVDIAVISTNYKINNHIAKISTIQQATTLMIDLVQGKYNIDTENVVIAGESAGGYYIAYAASILSDDSFLNKLGIIFRHKDDFKLKAVVSHCGCYDLKRLTDPAKKQSKFPDMKMMTTTFIGKNMKDLREILNSPNGYLYSPKIATGFPPAFVTWGDKDLLRYEAFDFIEELRQNNIPHKVFKSDGIIGMHAWSIVPLFKKSRICLAETFDFVLPYLSDYFEKNSEGEWVFRK